MNAKHSPKLILIILGAVLVAGAVWYLSRPSEILIGLKELPEVSSDVIGAQGSLFRVEEPFLYNRKTKVAAFVVEILSTKNFEGETHLVFGGDAKSLQSFVNEIRMVNSGPSRVGGAAQGMWEGVESLVTGLWQLLRHPIDSVVGLGSAAIGLAGYLIDTSFAQVQKDVVDLTDAFYLNRACEVADEYSADYFDLKTDQGKAAVHSETNFRLTGQAVVELATFLVPFSKLKYGGEAAKAGKAANTAAKAAEAANLAEKMAEAGTVSTKAAKFARVWQLFPRMAEKMAATLLRLKHAVTPARFTPPVAKLGKAASLDYKATFFAKSPQLEGKVVVHHAIEQQILTRYSGLLSEAEIHSLENLRGIPKSLDSTLHKSYIAKEWNKFYRLNPAGAVTKQKLLDKATEIDRKFGHLFQPSLL
jgi:hypothetical protein